MNNVARLLISLDVGIIVLLVVCLICHLRAFKILGDIQTCQSIIMTSLEDAAKANLDHATSTLETIKLLNTERQIHETRIAFLEALLNVTPEPPAPVVLQ